MKKPITNRCLVLILSAVGCVGAFVQPARAQYGYQAQQDAAIQQDAAVGALNTGQANTLLKDQSNLSQRAAKLLRNDGGVLTPADQAKLAREAAKNNATLNQDLINNRTGGSGVSGFFGNLFGNRSGYAAPAVVPYGTAVPGAVYPGTTYPGAVYPGTVYPGAAYPATGYPAYTGVPGANFTPPGGYPPGTYNPQLNPNGTTPYYHHHHEHQQNYPNN